jgi:hypothetical protein
LGRPVPDLNLIKVTKQKFRQYTRHFINDYYSKYNWFCECDTRNAVFCTLCLLFDGELSWKKTGMTDLSHLNEIMKKHDVTVKHIKNTLNLAVLGKTNIFFYVEQWNIEEVIILLC